MEIFWIFYKRKKILPNAGKSQYYTFYAKQIKLLYFQSDTKYNAFERDIAVVNIFYGKSTATGKEKLIYHNIILSYFLISEFVKTRKMTIIGFLSNIGGLFGLCLGFSIISFIEIFYWFVIRMVKNIGK